MGAGDVESDDSRTMCAIERCVCIDWSRETGPSFLSRGSPIRFSPTAREGIIMTHESPVTIRLKQSSEQTVGVIKRVFGLMPARFIVNVIDALDLEANPRNSRLGSVTDAIEASIANDDLDQGQQLFPFKTKGILLATSQYEQLDRGRYNLIFDDRSIEGVLDGGHNMLAIGLYILNQAEITAGKTTPRKKDVNLWADFKGVWKEAHQDIDSYLQRIASAEDRAKLEQDGIGTLNFLIPTEMLIPADQNDAECLETFRSSLLEICDARNNNAQLTVGTKGNKEGLFDAFRSLFEEKEPEFAKNISWKTNDGGTIESRNLIALAWIPLSLTTWVNGEDAVMDPPKTTAIYSGKGQCLDKYLTLMRNPRISTANTNGTEKELHDHQVLSALKVAVDIPRAFDLIYQNFPKYYNKPGGSYGKISAVKSMQHKSGEYTTPFYGLDAEQPVPDGFIYPLVYGLRACMEYDPGRNEVRWRVDPYKFIQSKDFAKAAEDYCGVIRQSEYDPQKVGKGKFSYSSAETFVELAMVRYHE